MFKYKRKFDNKLSNNNFVKYLDSNIKRTAHPLLMSPSYYSEKHKKFKLSSLYLTSLF